MNPDNFIFFQTVSQYIDTQIQHFIDAGFLRVLSFVQTISEVLVFLWVTWHGYRILTGQSRESLSVFLLNMGKVVGILILAHGFTFGNANIRGWIDGFSNDIVSIIEGGNAKTIYSEMDGALLTMQKIINEFNRDDPIIGHLNTASWLSMVGQGMPILIVGALIIINKITLALSVVLAPLFILMLIFDATKLFFLNWLKLTIGSIFALAMLLVISTMILQVIDMYAQTILMAQSSGVAAENAPSMMNTAILQSILGILLSLVLLSLFGVVLRFFNAQIASVIVDRFNPTNNQPLVVHSNMNSISTPYSSPLSNAQIATSLTQQYIRNSSQYNRSPYQSPLINKNMSAGVRGNAKQVIDQRLMTKRARVEELSEGINLLEETQATSKESFFNNKQSGKL